MHNYSTPYAIRILKNLVPALKPGARVVINDYCLSTPGKENPWDERVVRRMDVVMLAVLNAQERTEREFRELFRAAGEGFVFKVCCFFFLYFFVFLPVNLGVWGLVLVDGYTVMWVC